MDGQALIKFSESEQFVYNQENTHNTLNQPTHLEQKPIDSSSLFKEKLNCVDSPVSVGEKEDSVSSKTMLHDVNGQALMEESNKPNTGSSTGSSPTSSSKDTSEMDVVMEMMDEEKIMQVDKVDDVVELDEQDFQTAPAFYHELKVGDEVDAWCSRLEDWLCARISFITDTGFGIHFLDWNEKHDIEVKKTQYSLIGQKGLAGTGDKWKKIEDRINKRKMARTLNKAVATDAIAAHQLATKSLVPAFVEAGATRSGRKVTKRVLETNAHEKASPARKKPTAATTTAAAAGSTNRKKKKSQPIVVSDSDSCTEEDMEYVSDSDSATDEKDQEMEDVAIVEEDEDDEEAMRVDTLNPPELPPPIGFEQSDSFYQQLTKDMKVDVWCDTLNQWFGAHIEYLIPQKGFCIHFFQYPKSENITIGYHEYTRIAPQKSHAIQSWKTIERKKKPSTASAGSEQKKLQQVEDHLQPTEFIQTGQTRSGRKQTKRVLQDPFGRKKPVTNATRQTKSKKMESVVVQEEEVDEDILCGTCGEMEEETLSDMILCDGGCLGSYHLACLGLETAPDEEKWLCEQCRTNEQNCFLCGRVGTIGEKGGVFRCSVAKCGKFYHQKCVDNDTRSFRSRGGASGHKKTSSSSSKSKELQAIEKEKEKEKEEEEEEEEEENWNRSFRCGRHVCSVCEGSKKGQDLMLCLKCPDSYHPHCVPPSSRYNSVGMLCSRHPFDALPQIPHWYHMDKELETITVDFNLRLPLLFVPKEEPLVEQLNDWHHFRLRKNLLMDIAQRPPTYRKLVRSIYTFKPKKVNLDDIPMCECRVKCGEDCINRLSFTECFGPSEKEWLDSKGKVIKRESNCRLGEDCGNRALHQRIYPRFERFHSSEKGWGLRVLEPVKASQLVIEYVGEVINEEEKERRLIDHARNHPEDKNMYIMELDTREYIDARFKGSVSRFINHSCAPNCHLLKWNVRGVNRIAITALKDIEPGTELSYDYQFHTQQAMEWKCFCKAPTCRGTMAPKKMNQQEENMDDENKKTKKKKMSKKEIMRRFKMDQKLQEKEEKATLKRLSLTSQVSLGDSGKAGVHKSTVRNGPLTRDLMIAKNWQVFLQRNAINGFDFLKRKQLKDFKIKKKKKEQETKKNKQQITSTGTSICISTSMNKEEEDMETTSAATINSEEQHLTTGSLKKEEEKMSVSYETPSVMV